MRESTDHISCQEVVELASDYLERVLPADEMSLFEEHLNFCEGCVSYVEQMRMTIAALGRVGEEHVPDEMRERLVLAFRDWKHP